MKTRRVFIDADACPVTDIAVSLARAYGNECVLIADTAHVMEREGCQTIRVDKGADSADFRLVNLIAPGDIAVTQDYGLAAMCLSKKAHVLNQNGLVYNDRNIEDLLYSRYIGKKIRMAGGRTKGPKKRTTAMDEAFREALTALLQEQGNEQNSK